MAEQTIKAWKYRKFILEFKDYLLFMLCSKRIRQDEKLYKEYCKLLSKYEEYFNSYDI